MEDLIISFMNQYGFWGILILIAIENIFPPIPSEVILAFGGFMTTQANMTVVEVIAAATIGSVLGAVILYGIGRLLSCERLEKWMNGKLGRLLRIKPGDVLRARDRFENRGGSSVFFCRMIPVIRSLISIPAGMTKMNMPKFLLLTTAGSAIWNTVLVCLGAAAGASWSAIVGYMDTYMAIAVVLIGIGIALLAFFFYRKKRYAKKIVESE